VTAGVRIAALIHYPVKGAAGVPVAATELTPSGLTEDRAFLVVDPDGDFRTQRDTPQLALLRPRVDGDTLRLGYPGRDDLAVPIRRRGPAGPVTLFGKPSRGIDQGEAVAEWCSAALGLRCRLVRVPPDHDRLGTGVAVSPIGYADSTAVLVLSLSSVDDLNTRIVAGGGKPVSWQRFRPNVLLSGWDEPYTEDRIGRLAIGPAQITYAKPCIRCAVVLVDQTTGRRAGPEPLRTLARYRRHPAGGVALGMKAATLVPGPVAIDSPLTVLDWLPAEPPAPAAPVTGTRARPRSARPGAG
jgi:uncharacterized protein YcbX